MMARSVQPQVGREGGGAVLAQAAHELGGIGAGAQPAGPAAGQIGLEDLARGDPLHHLRHRPLVGLGAIGRHLRLQPAGGRGFQLQPGQSLARPGGGLVGVGAAADGVGAAAFVIEGQQGFVAGAGEVRPAVMTGQPQGLEAVAKLVGQQARHPALERRSLRIGRREGPGQFGEVDHGVRGIVGIEFEDGGGLGRHIGPAPGVGAAHEAQRPGPPGERAQHLRRRAPGRLQDDRAAHAPALAHGGGPA